MMLPMCVFSVSEETNIRWEYLALLGMISTCYGFWIYGKTRSTIVLFAVYFTSNLIPSQIPSAPLAVSLIIIGLAMTVWGGIILQKKWLEMLEEEDIDL